MKYTSSRTIITKTRIEQNRSFDVYMVFEVELPDWWTQGILRTRILGRNNANFILLYSKYSKWQRNQACTRFLFIL